MNHLCGAQRPSQARGPTDVPELSIPLRDDDGGTDLWYFDDLGSGKSVTNKAFPRVLHASRQVTSQGHALLYTCASANVDHAEEFSVIPVDSPDEFTFTGYFKLASVRTQERAPYGTDLTPGGRARVHQESEGSNLYLY